MTADSLQRVLFAVGLRHLKVPTGAESTREFKERQKWSGRLQPQNTLS